jgi:hypothetical protein
MGWVTAAATVISAVTSYQASRENAKYQERQRQIQIRKDRMNARRAKIAQVKEMQQAQATTDQSAVRSGSSFSSSGYQGASSSLQSQFGANTAFVNKMDGLTQHSNTIENKASKYSSMSSLFGSISNVAGNNFGGYSELSETVKPAFKSMFRS